MTSRRRIPLILLTLGLVAAATTADLPGAPEPGFGLKPEKSGREAAPQPLLHRRAADRGERPNVLFIISDDLAANALGCYGNRQCQTPNIDRLAAAGMRFDRAYCQYPVCGPARAALMSGLYAQTIGVTGNGASDRFTKNLGERPSMSQHFKNAGWYSARVSKIYHMRVPGDITAGVSGPDHAASWTEHFNCQGAEWMTRGEHEHLTNEKLKRDPDKHYNLGFGGAFYVVRADKDAAVQPDVQAATKAIELMRAHRDRPFFLAVGLVRPHVPLVAPADFFQPYPAAEMQLPERIENDWEDIPKAGISKNSRAIGLQDEAKQRRVLSAYYACVQFMDAQVGRLLDALDELQLRDKTIVVFQSDHGYHLGEHEFWQKMSLHDESTRIPFIISAPGHTPGSTHALVESIDLYPTLAELAKLDVPPHCQGVSLVPVLKDPRERVREQAYCLRRNGHMLRTDRWAYVRYNGDAEELYDMRQDPHQFNNLADSPEQSEALAEMRRRLNAKLSRIQAR